jgi:hypothetical protein
MPEDRDRLAYATAHAVFHGTADDRALWPALGELRASELRFALIADCLRAAAAGGHALPGELGPIRRLASALAIEPEQLVAIATYVLAAAQSDGAAVRGALAGVEAAGASAPAVDGRSLAPAPLDYAAVARACDRVFAPTSGSPGSAAR